jgi:hypothetical protein
MFQNALFLVIFGHVMSFWCRAAAYVAAQCLSCPAVVAVAANWQILPRIGIYGDIYF